MKFNKKMTAWSLTLASTLLLAACGSDTYTEEAASPDAAAAEKQPEPEVDTTLPYIDGDAIVYPYDEKSYIIQNASNGTWAIEGKSKATIINQTSQQADIVITTGRSGQFKLLYQRENEDDIVLNVTIESL